MAGMGWLVLFFQGQLIGGSAAKRNHDCIHTHDGSMDAIYAKLCQHKGGILMGSMLPYIPYMDPMGYISS